MKQRLKFFFSRLRERLWVKPLISCLLSIGAALLAHLGDYYYPQSGLMNVSSGSLETLLTIISASMLVMAVFAVGSMLAAYSSASSSATPHAFAIVITDDVSQYALSIFIGAFIFSIIGLIVLMNGLYQETGRLIIFILTIFVFVIVILGFVRWVDNIARLGSLGNTIAKVEAVTELALTVNAKGPRLGGVKCSSDFKGRALYTKQVGYLQRIDMHKLQASAEQYQLRINVNARVGSLVLPGEPLAYVAGDQVQEDYEDLENDISNAFIIGNARTFDEDPRYGLVVMSEIASRALSPAVNDPGTAIDILGALVRLLNNWAQNSDVEDAPEVQFDRVGVPEILLDDMFDDAFNAIARDGAGTIEVMLRLQKVYQSLATINHRFEQSAKRHSDLAIQYAEQALSLPAELELLTKKRVS